MSKIEYCLVGDIGGTNARLAVADLTGPRPVVQAPISIPRAGHDSFESVVQVYMDQYVGPKPTGIVIAIAGPIRDGQVKLTNGQWVVSEAGLIGIGFSRARLINDFAALGYAVDHLTDDDLQTIGDVQEGVPNSTIGIVGAGTGLGVAALVRDVHSSAVLVAEGGHSTFAPVDDEEIEMLKVIRKTYARVSTERVLSGPGLARIYKALAEIAGQVPDDLLQEEISQRAMDESDPLCVAALDRFCAIYGRFAGDMALTFGALGGIYLGGGLAPRFSKQLQSGSFRRAFEDAGRFKAYTSRIPTKIITNPYTALIGSAAAAIQSFNWD